MTEPRFRLLDREDPSVLQAHALAARTMHGFRSLLDRLPNGTGLAKLSFKDPDLSEERGKDFIFFLWLTDVVYHSEGRVFSGTFFEVPDGFEKWHALGSRLAFDDEDVFDWMVIDDGVAYGGFTIRLHRMRLAEEERAEYDEYMGVTSYADEIE